MISAGAGDIRFAYEGTDIVSYCGEGAIYHTASAVYHIASAIYHFRKHLDQNRLILKTGFACFLFYSAVVSRLLRDLDKASAKPGKNMPAICSQPGRSVCRASTGRPECVSLLPALDSDKVF